MNAIRQLFHRQRLCDDLSEEIREHLDEKIHELIENGMPQADAEATARREFGNVALIEEHSRETWHWMPFENFLADVRYGLRALRENPGFTSVAILTLALGIGANSAIFSLVNGIVLRSLPFAQPDRLVSLSRENYYPQGGFVAMKTTLQTMDVAAYLQGWGDNRLDFNLTGDGEPERLYGAAVSAEFFSLLGVSAQLGRTFIKGEDQPGKDDEVVVSHALWEQRFKSDPGLIGRHIMLSGVSREVVGVMPAWFQFRSSRTQIWIPLRLDPRSLSYWDGPWVPMIGRLRDGASAEKARAELGVFQQNLYGMLPFKIPPNTWTPASVIPLQQQIVGDLQSKLLILLGAIALVLLIACANVANLLLARAATREREMAVRAALGAGRWRICRQLLTESTLLGIAGSVAGLVLARFGISFLKSILPADTPRLATVSIDVRVLLFTAVIGTVTGLVFGLAPALKLSRVDLTSSLKTGSRNAVAGGDRLRTGLAVSEIALGVILVTAAGLMVKSLWQLVHVDPGFRAESIVSARLTPNQAFCEDFNRCQSFFNTVLQRVRGLPSVKSAALVNALPLNGRVSFIAADFEGREDRLRQQTEPLIFDSVISPEYLSVMQIPLLQGRGFTESDGAPNAEPVALITTSTARKFWPGQDPIGKHLKPAWVQEWRRVVGVVPDVHEDSLSSTLPAWIDGAMYEPYSAHAVLINRHPATELTVVVSGTTDQTGFSGALREIIANLDPEVPITEVQTLRGVVGNSVAAPRSLMSLFAIFAGLAVVLGAVGVYGVLSYSVAQRTSEIGVRMVLGAQRGDIQRMILGDGARIASMGVGLGIIGAFALTRLMANLLYGVKATDPATFAVVACLLAMVALVACYLPAQRAVRLDPQIALRCD